MATPLPFQDNPMALRATVYKVELQVSDLDRQVFETISLSLARNPSETAERLLVRLLAYALNVCEGLAFGRGISNDEEATLWQRDLSGVLRLWIEVGLPDERVLRRAAGRADNVVLYTYGGRAAAVWWAQNGAALSQMKNLRVVDLPSAFTQPLAALATRNIALQVTIQDGEMWVSVNDATLHVRPEVRSSGGL